MKLITRLVLAILNQCPDESQLATALMELSPIISCSIPPVEISSEGSTAVTSFY